MRNILLRRHLDRILDTVKVGETFTTRFVMEQIPFESPATKVSHLLSTLPNVEYLGYISKDEKGSWQKIEG